MKICKRLVEIRIKIGPDYERGYSQSVIRGTALFDDGSHVTGERPLYTDSTRDDRIGFAEQMVDLIGHELKAFLRREYEQAVQPRLGLLEMAEQVDAALRKPGRMTPIDGVSDE